MSKGIKEDWENTQKLLIDKKISPVDSKNRTWLRHDSNKSGKIDLMVLEGIHTIAEIAQKTGREVKDVRTHLEHLQNGNWRDKAPTDTKEPHRLKISPCDGKDNDKYVIKFHQ